MAEAQIYNQEGKKLEKMQLNPKIFEVEFKNDLVHDAVISGMAQKRKPYAHTKDRSDVRGGGAKPWRQKGTGRARHGSRRSPIWIGGGVTFGPTKDRNFTVRMNKKAKRKALYMALSAKVKDGDVLVLDKLVFDEPKTNLLAKILRSLPGVERRVLVVLDAPNKNVMQAVRNIDWIHVVGANNLSIVDVLNFPKIVILKEAFGKIDKLYSIK